MRTSRRTLLLTGVSAAALLPLLGGCSLLGRKTSTVPIVFVHGNGDNEAVWITTLWRFESNGFPRDHLFTVDVPYPRARDDDGVPQAGRSSTTDNMKAVAAEVDRALRVTGAKQVVLVGSSRGGNAIRSYVASPGGARKVAQAVLCGTPSHGVWIDPTTDTGNEFNGAGPFLTGLNAPKGKRGDEVQGEIEWLVLRSDRNDKYAQPDGTMLGRPGMPTGVTYDSPDLKGADTVVLEGADHRETAFSAKAFQQIHSYVIGSRPRRQMIEQGVTVWLGGKVSGLGVDNARGDDPSNLPLVGAMVEIYPTEAVTGQRLSDAIYRQRVDADGRWGPIRTDAMTTLEFVVTAPGYAITHIYRSPFPRSSYLVNLVAQRMAPADMEARSVVTLTRPRGYFGVPRDRIRLDGVSPPAGIPGGVPSVSTARLRLSDSAFRSVVGEFNEERIAGWAWPASENHLVFLELHY